MKDYDSIYDPAKTHAENARNLDCNRATLSRYRKKIGASKSPLKPEVIRVVYEANPKKCNPCNKQISYEQRVNKFCSHSCRARVTNKQRIRSIESKETTRVKLKEFYSNNPTARAQLHLNKVTTAVVLDSGEKRNSYGLAPCLSCPRSFHKRKPDSKYCTHSCAIQGLKQAKLIGGNRSTSGSSKKGYYKGIFCSSTWELAWVIYNLDHNISFSRNTKGFEYSFNGISHQYYPDFILQDKTYVEIKGYKSPQWQAKLSQFPHPIQAIYQVEIQPFIDYVRNTYKVKNLTDLYDTNKPLLLKTNACQYCLKPCAKIFCSQICVGKTRAVERKKSLALAKLNKVPTLDLTTLEIPTNTPASANPPTTSITPISPAESPSTSLVNSPLPSS